MRSSLGRNGARERKAPFIIVGHRTSRRDRKALKTFAVLFVGDAVSVRCDSQEVHGRDG